MFGATSLFRKILLTNAKAFLGAKFEIFFGNLVSPLRRELKVTASKSC